MPKSSLLLLVVLGLALFGRVPAQAEHRATHLGHPATRFAPPLKTPGDLRKRFRDEQLKPDIASILEQWGWKGNLQDLHYAALTAEISDVKLPVGTRMPFMSSRESGRPITLRDVVWAGKAPVEAYVFTFSSNGRKYRCVTPKPCSNFFLEDLGAELPVLELTKLAPAEIDLCDPLEMKVTVRNTGEAAATQVKITDTLPEGFKTTDNQSTLVLEVGTLARGASREFTFQIMPTAAGSYVNQAQVTCAEGITADATATTLVQAPVLSLECNAPERVLIGRPVEVCLTVRNTGTAAERKTTLTLPIPAGYVVESTTEGGVATAGEVSWEFNNLAPNATQKVCAVIATPRQPGSLSLAPTVQGTCAPRAQSTCLTRVEAVSGILVEVIDLVDPVEVGQEVNYVITVTNQGLLTGSNIRILCSLPASQEYLSSTGPTTARVVDGKLVLEALPSLEGKAVASWQVLVKALSADDARFNVELRSDQFERPILEMEATRQY